MPPRSPASLLSRRSVSWLGAGLLAALLGASLLAAGCGPRAGATPPAATGPRWHPRTGPTLAQLLDLPRASAPAVSPDGSTIAFLSDAPGVAQPFSIARGGAARGPSGWKRLATIDDRVHFVLPTADGRSILMGRDHGGDENLQLLRVPAAGGELVALTDKPKVKHLAGPVSRDGKWLAYSSNERSAASFDVYVRPVEGEGPRRLYEATGEHQVADFSPDGKQLLVVEKRSSFDEALFLVSVATGERTPLGEGPGIARFGDAHFTGDGRGVLVLSDRGRDFLGLALLDLASRQTSWLLDEPHDIERLAVSPGGEVAAVAINDGGWHEVRTFDARDARKLRPLARPALGHSVIRSLSFSADGKVLAAQVGRASSPDQIVAIDMVSGVATQLTTSEIAPGTQEALVEPTLESVKSFDGLAVPIFVFRPADLAPGERAPVVVWVHGGPESQFQPAFSPLIQFLVGHGYIVAAPNVRGSTGYGNRYTHLDDVEKREDSVRDLGAVNRWLRDAPGVDPDRIAVLGGSYGGYMVLAALTLQPELWAAGCDVVGIASWRTFLERTAPYRRAQREAEYGSLARDGALLDRISPLRRVAEIKAPLMVIHGANDPRVPVTEAEQIVAALQARGQRVEYQRFANEGHGLARRENQVTGYGKLVTFFDEILGR
jgi:dipeptidyl aminopeptidase/acylaminoacyl peptidase